jgi:hypothetical protein
MIIQGGAEKWENVKLMYGCTVSCRMGSPLILTSCSVYGVLKFNVFSVLYLYTSIYLSSDLHVLFGVHLRMAHVGRNM